jgi:hypothetical protein
MAEGREKSLMVNNIVVAEAMLLLALLFLMPLWGGTVRGSGADRGHG